jgi:nitroimidazol reductase NimA-like FMN-containing flavoprotein (pyridoxamine 5'-phosphate oxidase superfamily)
VQVPPLSEEGIKELLQRPIVAELATVNVNGEVRITPIWFEHRDGTIVMSTWENSGAARNIKRNPKCSLMIDQSESFPYYGVHYWGTATIEGPENDVEGIGKMFARYMNGDVNASTEYAKQLVGWGKRVYIHFKPERKSSWDFRQG